MKKVVVTLAILVATTLSVSAVNQKGNRGGYRGQIEMSKELNLSADQQKQIESTRADYKTKIDAVRADSKLSEQEKRDQIKALSEQQHTAIQAKLTPEQQKQWQEVRSERKSGMGDRNRSNSNGNGNKNKEARMTKMAEDLNLTDQQQEQIKTLNTKYKQENRERSQEYRTELSKILTPEQQAKAKEMRSEKQGKQKKNK